MLATFGFPDPSQPPQSLISPTSSKKPFLTSAATSLEPSHIDHSTQYSIYDLCTLGLANTFPQDHQLFLS